MCSAVDVQYPGAEEVRRAGRSVPCAPNWAPRLAPLNQHGVKAAVCSCLIAAAALTDPLAVTDRGAPTKGGRRGHERSEGRRVRGGGTGPRLGKCHAAPHSMAWHSTLPTQRLRCIRYRRARSRAAAKNHSSLQVPGSKGGSTLDCRQSWLPCKIWRQHCCCRRALGRPCARQAAHPHLTVLDSCSDCSAGSRRRLQASSAAAGSRCSR